MGTIIKLKCNECDIDNELSIGMGMSFDPTLLGYKPAYCPNCGKYVSVRVDRDNGGRPVTPIICNECGLEVNIKELDGDTSCDKCGGSLSVSEIGMWD